MLSKLIVVVTVLWFVVLLSTATANDGRKLTREMETARQAKSEKLRKYMNETADPCEDYFDFVCGNWKTYHAATATEPQTRSWLMDLEKSSRRLPQMLSAVEDTDTEAERKVKHFYASCLAMKKMEPTVYRTKIMEIASGILEMPALKGDKWQEEDFDWLQTVAEISHKYGFQIILGYTISSNTQDQSSNDMLLGNHELKFPNDLVQFASELITKLDLDIDFEVDVINELFQFEKALEEAHNNDDDDDNPIEIDIEELCVKYLSQLDMKKLLNTAFGFMPTGVIQYDQVYLESLIEIMKKTPKRVVANYIYYYLFLEFWTMVEPALEEVSSSYCEDKVMEEFKDVVSSMIYRSYSLATVEPRVAEVWEDIRTTLQILLESSQLKWFDDSSREYALEKLHSVKMMVASYKDVDLDARYSQLVIHPKDYVENLKLWQAFKAANTRDLLNETPQHMHDSLTMSSAVYSPVGNVIVIPVSELQDFLLTNLYPKVVHFSRLGFTLGHEVVHGFSGTGRKFNKMGEYRGDWNDDIENEFAQRRQCLYDQYTNYTFGGVPLTQDEGQDENAADIVGILLAYQAYRRWYTDTQRTQQELELEALPDFHYTTDQLFFIDYAQYWCAHTYEPMRAEFAASDEHSPDEFRTFVPLTNFQEFAKAFQCPLGSAMNPVKKCSIY